MSGDPELVRAIVLAALVKAPDRIKRQLVSRNEARRARAEDAVTAIIVAALAQRRCGWTFGTARNRATISDSGRSFRYSVRRSAALVEWQNLAA